jgi:glutamate racemase
MCDPSKAIGVFDSGVGGLTVLNRIAEKLPREGLVYLGDTARVPYGTKSPDTVLRYARACAQVLMKRGVKLIVVACNTASAYALEELREELPVPVLGVIDPGARLAVELTKRGAIGVIGTAGTVASGAYQDIITSLAPKALVQSRSCPLFVPLAEEGWTSGEVPAAVARTYLEKMLGEGIDTLVLGCTHYPLLKDIIGDVAGPSVTLVDSAEATASVVVDIVEAMDLARQEDTAPSRSFLVTDGPEAFAQAGERFFGQMVNQVEWVDIK